jgi:hypothetical protein
MLGKTSVSMMVLLVVEASLIGISVIYQYIEGQGPPGAKQKQPQQQAKVKDIVGVAIDSVDVYASSDGKACIAQVQLSGTRPNSLGLALGSTIDLLAPLNALPPTLRATGEYPIARLYVVHRAGM